MAFKSYASPGKFNPRQVQDQTKKMLEHAERTRQGMQAVQNQKMKNSAAVINATSNKQNAEMKNRQAIFDADTQNKEAYRKQVMQNYEIELQNMQTESQNEANKMAAVADFSKTAAKGAMDFMEQREAGMQEAYAQAVFASGITAQEALEITKLDTIQTGNAYEQNATIRGMLDRGVSLEMIQFLQKTGAGGSNRYLKSKALMMNTVASAPFELETLKSKEYRLGEETLTYNDAVASGDINQIRQLQQRMNQDYIRSSGLAGFNAEMLGTMAYPKINEFWKRESNSVAASLRKTAANRAKEGINQSFETQFASDGVTGVWGIVENAPDRRQARIDLFEWAGNKARSGAFSDTEFTAIANMPVTIGNKTRTVEEWYGGTDEFVQMERDFADGYRFQREKDNRWLQERSDNMKKAELEIADLLLGKDNLTQKDIDDAKRALLEQFPDYRGTALDNIETVDEETLRTQQYEAQEMAKNGTLTLDKLSKFDYRVFREFRDVAIQNSKGREDTNDYTNQIKAITNMVKNQTFVSSKGVSTEGGVSVQLKIDEQVRLFQKKRAELQQQYPNKDPIEIANAAVIAVREEFVKQTSTPEYQTEATRLGGYPEMLDIGIDGDKEALNYLRRKRDVQGNFAAIGARALDNTGLIITEAEANMIVKDYGQPGWKPTPLVQYVADTFGMSPTHVINAQLEAFNKNAGTNFPLIDEAPSIEAVNSNVPAEVRGLLRKYQNPSRSTRGMGASGTFMPETIPNGYGEYIQDSSARYGVNPSAIAALAEIESSFNPNAVSPTGAWGVMQIQGDMHPAYTGGADPQANIDYGTKYYSELLQMFGGDEALAAGAYNSGPGRMQEHLETGRPLPAETVEHMRRFKIAQYKYGKVDVLQDPDVMRSSSPIAVYMTGNIGPTSTGQHLDVKKVGGGRFEETALDDYVEVEDPEFGRISLGELRQRTGGVGDNWDEHAARGSHGIDYGTYSGTPVYLKNGAKLIGSQPSEHGDVVTIELPTGEQYTFLHGTKA